MWYGGEDETVPKDIKDHPIEIEAWVNRIQPRQALVVIQQNAHEFYQLYDSMEEEKRE